MARFTFTIEYEGTRYSGWQVQKNARTVQGELIGAIADALGTRDFEFMGSGRTDAGVHAKAQIAHLEARTVLSPRILMLKINDSLPSDVHVLNIEKAPPRFHARHHAVSRGYLYQVSQRRTAFGKRFVWWVKDELDEAKMRKACEIFEGFHDFRSFTADDPEEKSTTVDLLECSIEKQGALYLIRIRGSHFLWKMVRQMVGLIVEVGRGRVTLDQVHSFLKHESDIPAKYTAPPSGLFLDHVLYSKTDIAPPVQSLPNIQ
ncbi:MAG: tRNA pseudouridine(38-40) synthase TruA [Ignavibacteria bacterium]|nr:tRNA pseudouridine(38-40) synthase TruA [Ignavibacteria bacterium]